MVCSSGRRESRTAPAGRWSSARQPRLSSPDRTRFCQMSAEAPPAGRTAAPRSVAGDGRGGTPRVPGLPRWQPDHRGRGSESPAGPAAELDGERPPLQGQPGKSAMRSNQASADESTGEQQYSVHGLKDRRDRREYRVLGLRPTGKARNGALPMMTWTRAPSSISRFMLPAPSVAGWAAPSHRLLRTVSLKARQERVFQAELCYAVDHAKHKN